MDIMHILMHKKPMHSWIVIDMPLASRLVLRKNRYVMRKEGSSTATWRTIWYWDVRDVFATDVLLV